jgi:hypothetical protein
LYDWLTGANGLKFVVRYHSSISGTAKSSELVAQSVRASWWQARFGTAVTAICSEGIVPLAFDLLTYAGAWKGTPSLLGLTPEDENTLKNAIDFLSSASTVGADQAAVLSRTSVVGNQWPPPVNSLHFSVRPVANTVPAYELKNHPELIKDLTGSGVGLEALLSDSR